MKNALQALMILLAAAAAAAIAAGLAGIDASLAFITSNAAFSLYAVIGVMLIGFNDYSYRRRPVGRRLARQACPVVPLSAGRPGNVYGIRRQDRIAA